MKILYFFSFLLVNFILSCALEPDFESKTASEPNISEPNIDELLYYGDDQWPLSCYYYDPKSKDFGQNLPMWNRAWEWAKTPEGAHIHAKGNKEGGFLVAQGIYYSKGKKLGPVYVDVPGEVLMPDIVLTDDLEKLCQASIDRAHPNKGYKLTRIVGSRNTKIVTNIIPNAFPVVMDENLNSNKITRIVIFGDSLSDTGNLLKFLQIMPARPYSLGRFSNGGVWNDFLGDQANLSVLNYAMGGAVTKSNVTNTLKQVIDYIRDVGRYFVTSSLRDFIKDYSKNALQDKTVPNADRTLFVIWGGGNDFLSRFDRKEDINDFIDKPNLFGAGSTSITEHTVFNLEQEIKGLVALGAKNILVANLPDMGRVPRVGQDSLFRNNSAEDKYFFAKSLSKTIEDFNQRLDKAINGEDGNGGLKKQLPGINLMLFDAAGALNDLMEGRGPRGESNFDYGIDMGKSFTTLSAPGKPDIKIGKKCYLGGYLGSAKDSDICSDADRMLFWDEVHPTAVGHCAIGFRIHLLLAQNNLVSYPNFADYRRKCSAR